MDTRLWVINSTCLLFVVSSALGPLLDSESESSEDEGEISSPEVKALQAAASKVLTETETHHWGDWCLVEFGEVHESDRGIPQQLHISNWARQVLKQLRILNQAVM